MSKASKIIIQPATDNGELHAIFRLRYQNYLRKGYIPENPSRIMSDQWDRLATTIHYVAVRCGNVIGSVRLVLDSEEGLPMERVFPDEIHQLRKEGGMLAEASALVTAHEDHKSNGNLWLRLSRHLFAEAKKRNVDHLSIAVTQNHLDFYKRIHFDTIGPRKHYGALNNVFAYPLRVYVEQVRLKRTMSDRSPVASMQDHLLNRRDSR